MRDWGPSEDKDRRRFWQKKLPEKKKPAFGFSRALEEGDEPKELSRS